MNKYYKPLTLVIAFLILSLATVASFAYFTASVNGNSNAYDNVITTGQMALMLNDGEQVGLDNAIPGDSIVKEFSVKNTGTVQTTYDVYFSELLNTFEDKNDLVYTLTSEGGCSDDNEKIVPSDESKMVSSCFINPNQTHNYTLTITFKDDGTNQDDNKGKKFKTKISVNKYKNYESEGNLASGPVFFDELWNSIAGDKSNIRKIIRSENAPLSTDSYVIVNTESDIKQDYPVYMWYEDGTVYMYSNNDNVYLNSNCQVMFAYLTNLQEVDLSMFNTIRVHDMQQMFYQDESLESLNFDQFETVSVSSTMGMFGYCSKLKKLDLSHIRTNKILSNVDEMFIGDSDLEELIFGDDFDISKETQSDHVKGLFTTLGSLKKIKFGNNFNINVNSIIGLLNNKFNLEEVEFGDNFITSNVKDISLMFAGDGKLVRLINLNKINTSNVENMYGLFMDCALLKNIDLSSFNTSNVTNMQNMFIRCGSLEYLDLSSFDVSNVVNAATMFMDATNLKTIYTSSDWTLGTDADSNGMFVFCNSLIGGSGTTYDINHISKEYARIDDPEHGKPGYFTLKTN